MKKLAIALAVAFGALTLTACTGELTPGQKEAAECAKNPQKAGCPGIQPG